MEEMLRKMGYSNKLEEMETEYTDKLELKGIVVSLDVLPPVDEIAVFGEATINVWDITVVTEDITWGKLFQLIDIMHRASHLENDERNDSVENDEWHNFVESHYFLEQVRISGPVNGKFVVDTDWGS